MYRFQSPELNYMNLDEASFSVKFSPFVNERNVIDLMEELAKAERHITQNGMPRWSFLIYPYKLPSNQKISLQIFLLRQFPFHR